MVSGRLEMDTSQAVGDGTDYEMVWEPSLGADATGRERMPRMGWARRGSDFYLPRILVTAAITFETQAVASSVRLRSQ